LFELDKGEITGFWDRRSDRNCGEENYRNWGEGNLFELERGEITGTGERRTYRKWGEENLFELQRGIQRGW
jgi:hypothetical protein